MEASSMPEHHQTHEIHQRLRDKTRTRVVVKENFWGCHDTQIVSQSSSNERKYMKTVETKAISLFKYYK